MGTKSAPSIANLPMGDIESKHVYTYHKQPFIWCRFIDDIFIILTHGLSELEKFISHLNHAHYTLKFTYSHLPNSTEFSRHYGHQRWPHSTQICIQSPQILKCIYTMDPATPNPPKLVVHTVNSYKFDIFAPDSLISADMPLKFYSTMPNMATQPVCWSRNYNWFSGKTDTLCSIHPPYLLQLQQVFLNRTLSFV